MLYSFKGVKAGEQFGDGANPNGGLGLDSKGAIYGSTYIGGYNCPHNSEQGCGTVFRLRPPSNKDYAWTEQELHVFMAETDGANPAGGLIFDSTGSLYGTAEGGSVNGGGIAFRLTPANGGRWDEIVLHWFNNNGPGAPLAGLLFDSVGNLYGTTIGGESSSGTVFRLKPPSEQSDNWSLNILYSFEGPPDGHHPLATLVFDAAGNLYGTTEGGGSSDYGIVFKIGV